MSTSESGKSLDLITAILPEGPYSRYVSPHSSGFLLRAIAINEPLIAEQLSYLSERGFHFFAPLDTACCEIVADAALKGDIDYPFVRAIRAIAEQEQAGHLEVGSNREAVTALMAGNFETTTWMAYVMEETANPSQLPDPQ